MVVSGEERNYYHWPSRCMVVAGRGAMSIVWSRLQPWLLHGGSRAAASAFCICISACGSGGADDGDRHVGKSLLATIST